MASYYALCVPRHDNILAISKDNFLYTQFYGAILSFNSSSAYLLVGITRVVYITPCLSETGIYYFECSEIMDMLHMSIVYHARKSLAKQNHFFLDKSLTWFSFTFDDYLRTNVLVHIKSIVLWYDTSGFKYLYNKLIIKLVIFIKRQYTLNV
ncbi:hypothetical protein V1477_014618 [Vespula maculifrons]|uniref:Uncharacterized protein n=1 Tax=Vespula maculifrons TaxID=7453 RepID=A0ABD2BHY9_VESMC